MTRDLKRDNMLDDLKLPARKFTCKVRSIKETLDTKDAVIFENSVMDQAWPLTVLSRELNKRNISISDNSMRRHRLKECSCWRT